METGGVKWEGLNAFCSLEGTGSAENGEKGSTIGSSSGAGEMEMKGIGDETQDIEAKVTSTRSEP
jgi:hypothetical protein